jgi:hypothetical protein
MWAEIYYWKFLWKGLQIIHIPQKNYSKNSIFKTIKTGDLNFIYLFVVYLMILLRTWIL